MDTTSLPAPGTSCPRTLALVLLEPGAGAAACSLEWAPGSIFVTSFPFHSKFDVSESGHQSEVTGLSFGCKKAGKAGAWLPYKEVVSAQTKTQRGGCRKNTRAGGSKVRNDHCRGEQSPSQESSTKVFFPLSLSVFSPKGRDSKPRQLRCLSFPSFPHSSSAKTAVR